MRFLCPLTLVAVGFFMLVGCSGPRPAAQTTHDRATSSPRTDFRVVAYLPNYRLPTIDPGSIHNVTDLIFFSIAPKPNGDLDLTLLPPATLQKLQDLTQNGSPRISVAIGGWSRSGGFAPMVQDPAARKRFSDALTQFCLANRFVGADFDWEGPANPAERSGYAALLTEIKASFLLHKLRLTIALASWDKQAPAALKAVDAIHIMAYDHDGPHATFAGAKEDIKAFLDQGVPKEKLILGLPFYGRSLQDRNKDLAYFDIVKQFHPAPDSDQVSGYYFNGQATIRQKVDYARTNGLGGVMIWEIGQDTTNAGSLLETILKAMPAQTNAAK